MKNIEFMSGVNRQAIYKGECDCGNVITFTPGKPVTCVQCGNQFDTDIETRLRLNPQPATRQAVGPKETKSKTIENK